MVETKMTRPNLGEAEIGDQLIHDIARYRGHPDCDALAALVWDPTGRIRNPRGLERDLSGEHEGMLVQVVIVEGV